MRLPVNWSVLRDLFLFCTVVLLAGCSSMRTGVHFDEQYGFEALQKFYWLSDEPAVIPPDADPGNSPLLHKYIKQGIADVLVAQGFQQAATRESADFLVAYLIGSRDRLTQSRVAEVYQGPSWGAGGVDSFVTVEVADHEVFRESTLSIDLFAAQTQEPIWHGWATKTITDVDRAAPRAPVREAIQKILAPFPPSGR